MVIFGGLEIVAAGYVLHELGKDEDKARVVAERQRRRRHHHRHEYDSHHRPRPPHHSQNSLAPPLMAPPRPNSAPPVQSYRPPPPSGSWQNGRPPQFQQQQRPQNAQTWPQRPNPQSHPQNNAGPMFRPHDFPSNPHTPQSLPQQPPPPYQQYANPPPPPGPGHLQSRPTMHYDTKTGKWQSDMLPPEMPRTNSMPTTDNDMHSRARSLAAQPAPPSHLRRGRRAYSTGSWSSSDTNSDSDSDSDQDDLAYGNLPGRKQQHHGPSTSLAPPATISKVVSHERERPLSHHQQQQQYNTQPQDMHGQQLRPIELPVEQDWYASLNQSQKRRQEGGGGGGGSRWNTVPPPVEMEQPMRYELP